METAQKICSRCGVPHPATTEWFHRHKQSPDGLLAQCKKCRNAQQRQWVANHYSQHLSVCHNWKQTHRPDQVAYNKQWYKTEKGKREQRAVWIAASALKRGRLVRPDRCEVCGREVKPHMHHEDYDKPLQVDWLCRRCHTFVHNVVRELARIAS